MLKRVLLIPGQGTQYIGMAGTYAQQPWAAALLERADEAIQYPVKATQLSSVIANGPQAELNRPELAQSAVVLASLVTPT